MMEERLSRIMLACCLLFAAFAMFCMLRFSGAAEPAPAADQEAADALRDAVIPAQEAGETGMRFPLPDGFAPETLTVANHYDSRAVVITLPGAYGDFYRDYGLTGGAPGVESILLSEPEGRTVLELRTTEYYECRYTVEDGMLILSFIDLPGTYDKIVVLDAGWRNTGAEREAILDITQRARQKLEAAGIHVCCTGLDDSLTSGEERAGYANALPANLLVSIRAGKETETGIRAFYNGAYVIPSFGNPELAVLLGRHVASASGVSAPELLEMDDGDTLLSGAEIPAAAVSVGCLTDPGEAELLSDAQYREKLAMGIADAVTAAFAAGG